MTKPKPGAKKGRPPKSGGQKKPKEKSQKLIVPSQPKEGPAIQGDVSKERPLSETLTFAKPQSAIEKEDAGLKLCGRCRSEVIPGQNYCNSCGMSLDWTNIKRS